MVFSSLKKTQKHDKTLIKIVYTTLVLHGSDMMVLSEEQIEIEHVVMVSLLLQWLVNHSRSLSQ